MRNKDTKQKPEFRLKKQVGFGIGFYKKSEAPRLQGGASKKGNF